MIPRRSRTRSGPLSVPPVRSPFALLLSLCTSMQSRLSSSLVLRLRACFASCWLPFGRDWLPSWPTVGTDSRSMKRAPCRTETCTTSAGRDSSVPSPSSRAIYEARFRLTSRASSRRGAHVSRFGRLTWPRPLLSWVRPPTSLKTIA